MVLGMIRESVLAGITHGIHRDAFNDDSSKVTIGLG